MLRGGYNSFLVAINQLMGGDVRSCCPSALSTGDNRPHKAIKAFQDDHVVTFCKCATFEALSNKCMSLQQRSLTWLAGWLPHRALCTKDKPGPCPLCFLSHWTQ